MKGCFKNGHKSNLSILFWLVVKVWIPHHEMLMQESQGMGNVQCKGFFSLYQNNFPMRKRELIGPAIPL